MYAKTVKLKNKKTGKTVTLRQKPKRIQKRTKKYA